MGRVLGLFADRHPTGHVWDEVLIKDSESNESTVDRNDGAAPHRPDYSAPIECPYFCSLRRKWARPCGFRIHDVGCGCLPLIDSANCRKHRLHPFYATQNPGQQTQMVDGWVIFGATKQIIGVFLAVYVMAVLNDSPGTASEPVHQFFAMYTNMMPTWLAITLAVILVVMSQIKINVTNAYSGSLAWTNAYTRLTRRYPGRIVFVFVNVGIALSLMEFNMFSMLNSILGFYSNVAIAWIFTVASDIAINKYVLGISPRYPEYRRGMIFPINPVGIGALLLSATTSIAAYFGVLGATIQPYSALLAAAIAVVATPLIAIITRGQFYLRRTDDGVDSPLFDDHGNPSDELFRCCVTGEMVERPDVLASAVPSPTGEKQYISSLALTTDRQGRHVLPVE